MGLTGTPVSAPFPHSDVKSTTEYAGPFGRIFVDDSNGAEYMIVDCTEELMIGEVVVINTAGQASAITSTSRGRVGIIVATVAASDTAAYALISGLSSSSVLCSSGVSTAGGLFANASTDRGSVGELTSSTANIVFGMWATQAASTATSPEGPGGLGAFMLNRPYVIGDNGLVLTT